jgi:2-polyprenyl-6-methoxyphenol hydroxylase-like FAD-dependent oxidoreductase
MSHSNSDYSVTVVGGGLVGALCAVTLAQRGWQVDLYELRQDMRGTPPEANRSINLALSERGIHALKRAGAYKFIEPTLIPMKVFESTLIPLRAECSIYLARQNPTQYLRVNSMERLARL